MPQNKRAFTLIEVVVALALFAISILVLSQSFVNGLICKQSLTQDRSQSWIMEAIRCTLSKLKREQVDRQHSLSFPGNNESIQWQGKVNTTPFKGLYDVEVVLQEDSETYHFWIRRSDWESRTEQQQTSLTDDLEAEERGEA